MSEPAIEVVRQEAVEYFDFATLPVRRLRKMLKAGEDILEVHRVLARTNDNVVGEVIRDQGTFFEWDHYPKGDVFDNESHAQYFYHAHPSEKRDTEHGHFHTFIRAKGMPKSMRPVKHRSSSLWPKGDDALSHLVAISMDPQGHPLRIFTTNRWVTGETWYKANDVCKLVDRFDIDHARPSWPANRWVSGMIRLFWPQITLLLRARDMAIENWMAQHPKEDVFEDRRLELTSQTEISLDSQIKAVRAAAKAKAG